MDVHTSNFVGGWTNHDNIITNVDMHGLKQCVHAFCSCTTYPGKIVFSKHVV